MQNFFAWKMIHFLYIFHFLDSFMSDFCCCNTWVSPLGINKGLSHLILPYWRLWRWYWLFLSLSARTSPPVRGTTRRTKTAFCGGKITSPKRSAVSPSPASSTSRGGETRTRSRPILRCVTDKLETGGRVMLWNLPRWHIIVTTGDYRWPSQPAASHVSLFQLLRPLPATF